MTDYGAAPPAQRRRTWPWWIVVGVLAVTFVVLAAAIFYFVIKPGDDDPAVRSARFRDRDPHGFLACGYYEMWMDGAMPAADGWPKVRAEADQATTAAIRDAATTEQLHTACADAGVEMGDYRPPPG